MKRSILLVISCFFHLCLFAQTQRSLHEPLPTRQVHVDFHTSELIPGIGARFDKKAFQDALKLGHVNQINLFSKCHHSWTYYPSAVGKQHPHLNFDLLGAQLEACREIGVKAPIYFTVGWSANDAEKHPEWCARNYDGYLVLENDATWDLKAKQTEKKPHYSWKLLSPVIGSDCHFYVLKQMEELCRRYKTLDGFWFDIYQLANFGDYSAASMKRMKEEGVDITNKEAVIKSTALAIKAHMKVVRELVAKYHPTATVYFNPSPHVGSLGSFRHRLYEMNTQQELEDLPTTWGGYDKLPIEPKYHLAKGTPVVAMSGKFHKAWGEFGGFKHSDALKYEAAAMISFGASCNFGDQLHPSGEMDTETYRNIGEAYQYVEKIEKFGPGGRPVSRLGVWLTLNTPADRGVVNMLLELHKDFVLADETNLDALSVVVMPSGRTLTKEQAVLLSGWMARGGKLIVFGEGALAKDADAFLLDVGADFVGKSSFDFDYTVVAPNGIDQGIVKTPFLNYEAGLLVKPTKGTVLARIRHPYFNRTYAQYSGHRETPYEVENSAFPSVVENGNVIFFAHNLDQAYYKHAVRLHRELFRNAIDRVYKAPLLNVRHLPSSGRVSLLKQEKESRYVAHLLYAPALQRGEVMVIEDLLPVPGVQVETTFPEKIKRVLQIPEGKPLPFRQNAKTITVNVPTFTMHTAIVFEY